MTKNEIQTIVLKSITQDKKCWIHFKLPTRQPLYGKAVAISDFDENWSKGFFRFSEVGYIQAFDETENVIYTKLHLIDAISYVKLSDVC